MYVCSAHIHTYHKNGSKKESSSKEENNKESSSKETQIVLLWEYYRISRQKTRPKGGFFGGKWRGSAYHRFCAKLSTCYL